MTIVRIMPDPPVDAISTKTVGFMGESLTAFLLELEFGKMGLRVAKLGEEEMEWDLFIFEPVKGTPFTKPTAIQVKSRSWESWWTYPTRDEFQFVKNKVEGMGYELWFSFVHYRYQDGHIKFGTYLLPAKDIKSGDFKKRREFGKDVDMLKITEMRDKARLKFHSRKMGIEDDMGPDAPTTDAGGDPLSVSKDLAGDWGENMAAFLLDSEYSKQGLRTAHIGKGYWPYDLFVDGPVDGTPFVRQAAISVKANSTETTVSKPSFEELVKSRSALDAKGIGLWLALLQCYYKKGALGFGMYLIDSRVLGREDFVDAKGSQLRPDLLSFVRARKKAAARIWTEEMNREG